MRVLVVYVGDAANDLHFNPPRLHESAFTIKARGPRERFTSAWCEDSIDWEDRGYESPRQETKHSGKDIATGLLWSPAAAGPSATARGFFLAAGDKPTEAELLAAEKARDAYRQTLVNDARASYQTYRHARNIGDEAKWAGERMGLEEDWLPLATSPCPNCGMAVKPSAATCRHCKLVLDEKKYAELHFATPPAAPVLSGSQKAARF